MNKYVADTMALILRLENRKMPSAIKDIFNFAENGKAQILIPSVVLFEIAYLSEKKKVDTTLYHVNNYLNTFTGIIESYLGFQIIQKAFEITDIPELHDRLISGYGKHFDLEILTNDPIIIQSKFVRSIWN